jgi:NAD(P)-dependent dehydrogenase (short-subunit alcohol dehydrogenase family)
VSLRTGVMLITGGSRGIGAACARRAARAGYDVCIGYVQHPAEAEALVAECRALGREAIAVRGDVANEGDVESLFRESDARLGRLDCLVNNAGVVAPQARLEDFSVARMRRIFEINVLGAFVCAREAVRRMSSRRGGAGGSIINISSAASYLGSPDEYIDYAASTGAIDTLTIGLAKEVARDGIRVNAVRPGLIARAPQPARRAHAQSYHSGAPSRATLRALGNVHPGGCRRFSFDGRGRTFVSRRGVIVCPPLSSEHDRNYG